MRLGHNCPDLPAELFFDTALRHFQWNLTSTSAAFGTSRPQVRLVVYAKPRTQFTKACRKSAFPTSLPLWSSVSRVKVKPFGRPSASLDPNFRRSRTGLHGAVWLVKFHEKRRRTFDTDEWRGACFLLKKPVSKQPSSLNTVIRTIAALGGFLG